MAWGLADHHARRTHTFVAGLPPLLRVSTRYMHGASITNALLEMIGSTPKGDADAAPCLPAACRMPEETAQSLAWAKGRDPNSLWVSTAIPGPSSFISNTGCFTYTNWSISDSDVSFGAAAPAWYVPHTQLLPRVAVVWPAPQAVGGQVLSVVLTRKEGKQLAKMLPGGL